MLHKQCQLKQFLTVVVTFGLIILYAACQQQNQLTEQLIGSWTNVDLKVSLNHHQEGDSAYQFEVPMGQWEAILNIKPILTDFRDDGSYRSEYRTLEDSLIREVEGNWKFDRDSLILIEAGTATLYHVEVVDSLVIFTGWLDWDQDGEADDLYTGRQHKVVLR
jgi:hypothetical protein